PALSAASGPRRQGALLYCILEAFASAELRNLRRLDLDAGAGAGIAAVARGALPDVEGTETDKSHGVVLLECLAHRLDRRIEGTTGRRLGKICTCSDRINQFGFIHLEPPLGVELHAA